MIPRPTTTSQAAITITISAKTWPSWLPSEREKASSARFPAFSISSRQSRITSGLRRSRTPETPTAKSSAERTRYQVTSISGLPPEGRPPGMRRGQPKTVVRLPRHIRADRPSVAAGQHHGTYCRYQEQKGGGLERDQEALKQQLADRRRGTEAELD